MSDANKIFEELENLGDEALSLLRKQAFSPNYTKTLRRWGISQACDLIGRSDTYIRAQEQKKLKGFPKPVEGKKGREYSLEQINWLRDTFKTRQNRNPNDEPAIISYANFKGGAAKTTSSVHSAQYFALQGYRVLFIDCDSQASATQIFGYNPDEHIGNEQTLLPILTGDEHDITKVIRKTYWNGLDLIPANLALYGAEFVLPAKAANHLSKGVQYPFWGILSASLESVKDQYDVIIIDCPPSMGMISINAIFAANAFVIPIPPSMLDFASTIQFFAMVKDVFSSLPQKEFAFVRLLITKHDNQDSNNSLVDTLRALYGNFVLRNMMYTSEAIRKASNDLLTIYEIEKYNGTKATFDRAFEFMNAVNKEIELLVLQMWGNTKFNGHTKKRLVAYDKEELLNV